MVGTAKKKPEDERKQVPLRLSPENWRRIQMAKINSGQSLQDLMFQAVDAWLRKHKHEGLEPEDNQS